ncbi:hypothetical protein E4U21_000963 [Claviceps maximensis]|nr:hypothetical protein E4U21_000963 [Claviceps maximensis]
MKFSTFLGGVVLSMLEVYHANASPMEESQRFSDHTAKASYVPYLGGRVAAYGVPGCQWFAVQSSRPPSQGGCADWTWDIEDCGREESMYLQTLQVKPAIYCQNPKLNHY